MRFPKNPIGVWTIDVEPSSGVAQCDDPLEMQFYVKECIKEEWKVRKLRTASDITLSRFCLLLRHSHLFLDPELANFYKNASHPLQISSEGLSSPYQYRQVEDSSQCHLSADLLELHWWFAY